MQLISLTAMEPPISFDANAVRDEQAKYFTLSSDERRRKSSAVACAPVRRRYGRRQAGHVLPFRGRRSARFPHRNFVAMKAIDRYWRWADVPSTPHRQAHAGAQYQYRDTVRRARSCFRDTPSNIYAEPTRSAYQPEEGISLQFAAKVPGPVMRLGTLT